MRRTALMVAAAALTGVTAASGASAQGYGGYPQQPYSDPGGYSADRGAYPPASQPRSDYEADYGSGYDASGNDPYSRNSYPQSGYGQPQSSYGSGYNSGYDAQGGAYPQTRYPDYPRGAYPQSGYVQPSPAYDSPRGYGGEASRAATGGSLASIFSCDASGGKQATGAVVGGLAGALLGRSLARGNRTLGTAIGAAVGAGAGSYIGCKMQRDDVARASYATNQALTYGSAQTWSNPGTGATGRVDVYADDRRYAQAYGGSDCRIVDQTFTTRSSGTQTERLRACRSGSDWTYNRI